MTCRKSLHGKPSGFVGLFWFCNPAFTDTRVNWGSDLKYLSYSRHCHASTLQVSLQGALVLCPSHISVMRPECCEYSAFSQWVFKPQWIAAADLNFEPRQLLNATRPKTTTPVGLHNHGESGAACFCTHNFPMGKCVRACVRACVSEGVIAALLRACVTRGSVAVGGVCYIAMRSRTVKPWR